MAWFENKGWKSPADVVKGYRGIEKLVGRDPETLLPIPRADDPAGFLAAMDRLGRPADPAKYEFAAKDGVKADEGYVNWARGAFHKAGLTAAQVKALTAEHNEYVAGVLAQQEKDYNIAVEADKKALLQKWGAGHERMLSAAKAAANSLGFTQEMIDAMERTVGYSKTMEHFAELGQKLGESTLHIGGDKGGQRFTGMMTPAEAKAEWEKMAADPNVMAALRDNMHPQHKAMQAKQTNLFRVMYPEGT